MSEALPLLFNCIFYLSYSSLDIAPEYPPDAPKSLVEKIAKTPSTNRKRILTEKMERLGYTKIRFVSHAGLTSETNAPETDRTIRSHWRRGHWRLQRHGPQLQFFKLLWIKPTVVNPANDPPKVGRQYNVNKKHVESGPRD